MGATNRQWRRAALALALALGLAAAQSESSSSIVQTKNYIDTISGYKELSTCAELVLSTVVRGEYSGCADTYALTSYTCFVSWPRTVMPNNFYYPFPRLSRKERPCFHNFHFIAPRGDNGSVSENILHLVLLQSTLTVRIHPPPPNPK